MGILFLDEFHKKRPVIQFRVIGTIDVYFLNKQNALGIGVSIFTVALIESIYNIHLRDIATNIVALHHV